MMKTTVYDIIHQLCVAKGLSYRRLAQLANINMATFISMMQRRPQWISVERLEAISKPLSLEWTDLFEPGREEYVVGTQVVKVSSEIPADWMETVLQHALEQSGSGLSFAAARPIMQPRMENAEQQFLQASISLLHRLNDAGLCEAMRKLLALEADPQYRREDN